MPDAADIAQFHLEQMEAQVGVGHRAKRDDRLRSGWCNNCDERIANDQKFCDDDCKDDFWARNPNRR